MEEGLKKGIGKGIEKGMKEIAEKLLKRGFSNEIIAEDTGLTIVEIEKMRNQI